MTTFEKVTVWTSTVAVTVTGTVYAGMKYLLQPADPYAIVNHPLQPLVLKLHIVTAPFLVFAIGLITLRHIWPHFQSGWKRARRSGMASALLTVPMIATGYAIQTLTSESWLRVFGYVHLALGILFGIGAASHLFASRRASKGQQFERITGLEIGSDSGYGKDISRSA